MSGLDALNPDFQDMLVALCAESAEFLIVGAYAVSFHGYARTTGDMDLFVRPSQDNAARVWRSLLRFGAPIAALGVTEADLRKPDMVVQIGTPPRRIDLLTGISGVDFEAAWVNRVEVEWRGQRPAFLGIEELLQNKRAAGRPKDVLDVEELERIRRDVK